MVAHRAHHVCAVLRRYGHHLGVMCADKADAVLIFFTDDDALGLFQHYAEQRANARRSRAEDQHGIVFCDLGNMCCPEAGGEHVAHQQSLPIGHTVGNFIKPLIGKGHAHIFRLPAVDAAAERPAAVLIRAVVDIALFAEKALAAESLYIDRYAVARLHVLHRAADCFHNADHLMSHRDTRNGAGNAPVLDVQVAGANAGERHLHNGVPLVQQYRLWLFR